MFVWFGITLSHFSPKLLKRAALAADPPDKEFEAVLLREQYRSLARLRALSVRRHDRGDRDGRHRRARPEIAALRAGLRPRRCWLWPRSFSLFRLTTMRRRELQTAFTQRRAVRAVTILGPGLALAFTVATAAALPHAYVAQRSLLLFALWVIAVASAFCLTRLAHAAALMIFCSSAPVIVAFLVARDGLTFSLAALLLIVSCLVIVMLSENYRSFEDILRAHFVIAAKHRASEDARRQATAIAHTDYLTGLPNRRWLQSWLASRIEAAADSARPFAIGLLDLDGFKPINDMHGHLVGDEILKQVGGRSPRPCSGEAMPRGWAETSSRSCRGRRRRRDALAIGRRVQCGLRRALPRRSEHCSSHLHLRLCALSGVGDRGGRARPARRRRALSGQGQPPRRHVRLQPGRRERGDGARDTRAGAAPRCRRARHRRLLPAGRRSCRPGASTASRRWPAGGTRASAALRRRSSFRWPSRSD